MTKLDRLSRSLAGLLDLMRLFEQKGLKFISLRGNNDTFLTRRALHAAHLGRDRRAGARHQCRAGRRGHEAALPARQLDRGLAAYGRRVENEKLEIVPWEAANLRRMRALRPDQRS